MLKTIKEASYIAVNKTEVIQILISVIINKVKGFDATVDTSIFKGLRATQEAMCFAQAYIPLQLI